MKIAMCLVALWALFQMTGCTSVPVKERTQPAAVVGVWPEYDEAIGSALTSAMIQSDQGDLCPHGVEPKRFWSALLKATAEAESGMDPRNKYTESFKADDGSQQVSQGLFQISLDDKEHGGACAGIDSSTILTHYPNLLCAMKIMSDLIGRERGELRERLGKYWSTIRDYKVDNDLRELLPECYALKADSDITEPGDK